MKNTAAPRRLPAKLVCPDVDQALMRTRLFAQIESPHAAAVWLQGPAGSGKTILAASYVKSRQLLPVWYSIDADDREPSTFFHFLTMALGASAASGAGLPDLPVAEAESREDWLAFARQFFRAMLAALDPNAVLILENVHDANAVLHELLALLVAESANRQRILFTSHQPPPLAYLDAIAKQQLAALTADILRFDAIETRTMVNSRSASPVADADLATLAELTQGWAAGMVLLSTQPLAALSAAREHAASRSLLFDYFSRMVIEKLPAETRAILEACAFLPEFDASLAATASGHADAARVLDGLHRDGLFVEIRLFEGHPVFQFHALLGEALRNRVGAPGSAAEQQAKADAGRALMRAGRIEASIPLLIAGGDFPAAATQLLQLAESHLADDRTEQLASWIGQVPAVLRGELPWLDYWLGMSLSGSDDVAARLALTKAHRRFQQVHDQQGCVLAAAAMVMSIASAWDSFEGYTYWSGQLHAAWTPSITFSTPEGELRAFVAFVGLLASGVGESPSADFLVDISERAVALIRRVKDANGQLAAALVMIDWFMNRSEQANAVFFENFVLAEVPLARASPSKQARWHWMLSMMNANAAHVLQQPQLHDAAERHREAALSLVHRHRLTATKISIAHAEADRCIWARDTVGGGVALDEVESQIQPGRVRQMVWHQSRRAQLALLRGDYLVAWTVISQVTRLTTDAKFPAAMSSGYYAVASNVLLFLRRYQDAAAHIERALAETTEGPRRLFELTRLFIPAIEMLDSARAWDAEPVGAFFGALRETGRFTYGRYLDPLLARLCAAALAHDVERTYVYELIRQRKFSPPENATVHWPWPLKIAALGGFKVSIADLPLVFEGKGQKKPLELLQYLVATQDFSASVGPKIQQVIDELWPSLDAKNPQASFDTTLHRLRKLIGVDDALIVADGRLTLNAGVVWCDVAAFEAQSAEPLRPTFTHVNTYAGPLFDKTIYPWSAAPRERLATAYARAVTRAALSLESQQQYAAAIELYERALQQDNLLEPFYRGLMRCHHALGDPSAALVSYRRCRELLSIVLGTTPSAETEALKVKIR